METRLKKYIFFTRNFYEFLCLWFGLGPASRIFTKFLKVPMTIVNNNCRFHQMQQILSLSENLSYLDKIVLNKNSQIKLKLRVQYLELSNGRVLIQPPAEVLIQTDASTKGCGATCNRISAAGICSAQEMKNHINLLELLAIKLAMQTFSKTLKHKAIHLQVDNMVALTYLLKIGGIQNLKLVQ